MRTGVRAHGHQEDYKIYCKTVATAMYCYILPVNCHAVNDCDAAALTMQLSV